jgi:hypothetical protein
MEASFEICVYRDGKYQFISDNAHGSLGADLGFSLTDDIERSLLFDAYKNAIINTAKDVNQAIERARIKN